MILPNDVWSPWPEPKQLATVILKANMPDVEKYQLGKTKVFFRAGSLAEMDAARSVKVERVLALVRRNMVRYRAVKYFRNARRAVITIQRWWRHHLAWRAIVKLRGEAMALARQRALQTRSNGLSEAPSPNGKTSTLSLVFFR